MANSFISYLHDSSTVIANMGSDALTQNMKLAEELIVSAVRANKPILVCGNGGSAADALHIAGELKGKFLFDRRPIKAIALSADVATLTAVANDYDYADIFARQVIAYAEDGALLIAISTSGKSQNVLQAVHAARESNMYVIGMTGADGEPLRSKVDVCLSIPSSETPFIQQGHQILYHYLCMAAERSAA